jgi:hypothetical protein
VAVKRLLNRYELSDRAANRAAILATNAPSTGEPASDGALEDRDGEIGLYDGTRPPPPLATADLVATGGGVRADAAAVAAAREQMLQSSLQSSLGSGGPAVGSFCSRWSSGSRRGSFSAFPFRDAGPRAAVPYGPREWAEYIRCVPIHNSLRDLLPEATGILPCR